MRRRRWPPQWKAAPRATAVNKVVSDAVVPIAIVAQQGCFSSAVIGLADAFGIANRWAAQTATGEPVQFQPRVVTPAGATVQGSAGFQFPADDALTGCGADDVVLVAPVVGDLPQRLADGAPVVTWLAEHGPRCRVLASVCTGVFFVAEAGLLRGRRTTTNLNYAPFFRGRYPDVTLVPGARVIDEGQIITAGATTAFVDLALHLITRFAGHEVAVLCAKTLGTDRNRTTQKPYALFPEHKAHGDATIRELQEWVDARFAAQITVEDMARSAALGTRTLNRRFRDATGLTPLEYLQRVRLEAAKRLLETSDAGVGQITSRIGYADIRSFTRLFRRHTGITPLEHRRRFGTRAPAR